MSSRIERFQNIWDAIEDSPEDAAEMERRSVLMIALLEHIRRQQWTRQEASQKLDAPADQIAMLLRSDIDTLTEDRLMSMCRAARLRTN